jgi:nitrous oxide reductase
VIDCADKFGVYLFYELEVSHSMWQQMVGRMTADKITKAIALDQGK